MQHGKCCYSDMSIPKEGHGKAVEHFHPQSIFEWQRNQWDNLLLVCPQCNGTKSNQFPVMLTDNEKEVKVVYLRTPSAGKAAIIDPSEPSIDPEEHLTYVLDDSDPLYGQVIPRRGSVVGRETISVTGIDDEYFLRKRKLRLLEVLAVQYHSVLVAEANQDAPARDSYLARFGQSMRATTELAGLARQYARYKRLDQKFGLDIPGPVAP